MPKDDDSLFAPIEPSERLWVIGAINGQLDALNAVHRQLAERIRPGDRLIYTGNYFGDGERVADCIDQILLFRRAFLALSGVGLQDIVFLRGANEEMFSKLLQLHFAPNPSDVLDWMLKQGLGPSIRNYGGGVEEGRLIARQGAQSISKWTSALRSGLRARDGHTQLLNTLMHAAYVTDGSLIFVHKGLDVSKPLYTQGDVFWWGGQGFDEMTSAYHGAKRLIRGAGASPPGLTEGRYTLTVDGGCGRGTGMLIAVRLDGQGRVEESLAGENT